MGGINQYIEKILISNGYKKNLVAEDYNKLAHILYACYSIDYECRRLLVLYKLYTKEETEEYGYNSIMRKWFGAGYGSTWKYFNKNTILGLLAALKNEMSSTEETTKMWDFYGFATVEKHWKEGKGVKTDMGNDMRLTSKTERMN
jgi:hypothetical protein